MNNLALVLQAQGKYDEAETMIRRALAGRQTMLRPGHPETLTSVSILAGFLQAQGKYDEVEPMNRRALGPEHAGHTIRNVAIFLIFLTLGFGTAMLSSKIPSFQLSQT
jgi:hypothetical protein